LPARLLTPAIPPTAQAQPCTDCNSTSLCLCRTYRLNLLRHVFTLAGEVRALEDKLASNSAHAIGSDDRQAQKEQAEFRAYRQVRYELTSLVLDWIGGKAHRRLGEELETLGTLLDRLGEIDTCEDDEEMLRVLGVVKRERGRLMVRLGMS
jgi:hypothetical protein